MNIHNNDFYMKVSIRNRILGYILLFTIVPLIVIYLVSVIGVGNINVNYNKKYIAAMENEVEENLDSLASAINETYLISIINKNIFYALENAESEDIANELKNQFSSLSNDYIEDVDIVTKNGDVIRVVNTNDIVPLQAEEVQICINETYKNYSKKTMDYHGNIYYVVSKKMINPERASVEGNIIFYISEKNICSAYKNMLLKDDSAYIVNGEGVIISSIDKSMIGSKSFFSDIEPFSEMLYNKKRYFITHYQFSNFDNMVDDWSFYMMISTQKNDYMMMLLRRSLLGLFLVLLIIVPVVSSLVSNVLTSSIKRLEKQMKAFGKDDFKYKKKKRTRKVKDEIAIFEDKFDEMEMRIQKLIEQNNIEKDRQRIAELNMLQAQINPHFLYNTLDSISWLAEAHDQQDIVDIVYALSKFFEISLHNGDNYITISQELEHIKSYIAVELIRFPELFDIEYSVEESLLNEKIIKIILQPIVENAIKHGLRGLKGRKGKILIEVKRDSEYILFIVKDNGIGCDVNKKKERSGCGGYGMKNVQDRIRMEYGEDCGIEMHSVLGEGTTVILKIKHMKERSS